MKKELPENLRKIRVLKNFSQEYVADQIGVSLSSYARYELGKVEIDFYSVAKLSELYKMSIDEIYHYGDPEFKAAEPASSYLKRRKVNILVELDGHENTLDFWMKKLKDINNVI